MMHDQDTTLTTDNRQLATDNWQPTTDYWSPITDRSLLTSDP
jgi:hypothetical protein